MPLHTDYRPTSFDEFIGNDVIKNKLQHSLAAGSLNKSILFKGPAGCGKTTLAYIVGKALGIPRHNFHEYNAANTRGINTIREIDADVHYAPRGSKYKAYLLDECHRLTGEAQDALLKLTEKPPDHVYFFLCTTEPQKLIKTLLQRCTPYEVKTLPQPLLSKLVLSVLEKENVTNFPPEAIRKVAQYAQGVPRNVLTILDSVIDIADNDLMMRAIDEVYTGEREVKEICQCLLDSGNRWKTMSELILAISSDPEEIRRAVNGYFQSILLKGQVNDRVAAMMSYFLSADTWRSGKPALTFAAYMACKE